MTWKRAGADYFLSAVARHFEVIVFTDEPYLVRLTCLLGSKLIIL